MMEFSLESYKEIVLDLQYRGFRTINPPELSFFTRTGRDVQPKTVIVRHDVDLGLHASLEMARLEKSLGVVGHYFFQLTSPFYSLLSSESLKIFDEIRSMGHGVGLHYDPSSSLSASDLVDLFMTILQWPAGDFFVSLHNPSVTDSDVFSQALFDLVEKSNIIPVRMNGPEIMDHFYYWSDSLMIPRRPLFEVVEEQNHLQLLFHPEQWVNGVEDYRQAFDMAHIKNVRATEQAKSAFYDGCEVSLKSRSEVDPVLLKEMRSGS